MSVQIVQENSKKKLENDAIFRCFYYLMENLAGNG